jgi:hypothetical protein
MKANWLSDFLKRLWLARIQEDRRDTSTPADPDALKAMVRGIVNTRPDELGCDECFEQVDRFTDMVLAGVDAAEALPLVEDHLNRCRECREEFEALLTAVRSLS